MEELTLSIPSTPYMPTNGEDFGFAFNDIDSSDWMIYIDIIHEEYEDNDEEEALKREEEDEEEEEEEKEKDEKEDEKEEEEVKEKKEDEEDKKEEEEVKEEKEDEEDPEDKEEEAISGSNQRERNRSGESRCYVCGATGIKDIGISSAILAARSPFFYKLFKSGMHESHEKRVVLRIHAYEEKSLMDMLYFIYCGAIASHTRDDILAVLLTSDKYGVSSCMEHCVKRLEKLPMSPLSAFLYLQLPSTIADGEILEPLIYASKTYLAKYYKDFTACREIVMQLPLYVIEIIFGVDGLKVESEDVIFDFIMKWARKHYPNAEERKEILTNRLAPLIKFSEMSCSKLKEAIGSDDFEQPALAKLIFDALIPDGESPYAQFLHVTPDQFPDDANLIFRDYHQPPVKVVNLDLPWSQCVVYLDLKKSDCEFMYESDAVYSQEFAFGGRWFSLMAECTNEHTFGLNVHMSDGSEGCTIDIDFAVMQDSLKKFKTKMKTKDRVFEEGDTKQGIDDLLKISWDDFINDEDEYFIDGFLHLRAQLRMNNAYIVDE